MTDVDQTIYTGLKGKIKTSSSWTIPGLKEGFRSIVL